MAATCHCELGRARHHLERAVALLEEALLAWGCWADEIRQLCHYRVADFDDGRVLTDPGYGLALDIGGPVGEAVRVRLSGCCLPNERRAPEVQVVPRPSARGPPYGSCPPAARSPASAP
jgi:hypothetical protein